MISNDLYVSSLSCVSNGPLYTFFREDTTTTTNYIIVIHSRYSVSIKHSWAPPLEFLWSLTSVDSSQYPYHVLQLHPLPTRELHERTVPSLLMLPLWVMLSCLYWGTLIIPLQRLMKSWASSLATCSWLLLPWYQPWKQSLGKRNGEWPTLERALLQM